MKTEPSRGSHLPALIKLIPMTRGPVLELGCGMYSTCYLHWACFPTKRPLVTLEGQQGWMGFAEQFVDDFHRVEFVADWEALDLSQDWSVALVDHDVSGLQRGQTLAKLLYAEYVVCHDAERPGKYGFDVVFPQFKWRYLYQPVGRRRTTMILSNVHDLKEFRIP